MTIQEDFNVFETIVLSFFFFSWQIKFSCKCTSREGHLSVVSVYLASSMAPIQAPGCHLYAYAI